jgi:hypothetical protein
MRRLIVSLGILLALFGGWTLWQRGCARKLADIDITGGAITVRNQTPEDWKKVRIWVNDYYSGTASEIRAGSFVREPVSRFVASQGQTLKATAPITSVVVLGTTASGAPLRVAFGKPAWY